MLLPSATQSDRYVLPAGQQLECGTEPEIIITLREPSQWPGITVSGLVVEACIKPEGK